MIHNQINFIRIADELYQNQFKQPNIDHSIFGINQWLEPRDIVELWMAPLLKILVQYLNQNNEYAKKVYLGERMIRPFREDISINDKKLYFETIVEKDTDIIYKGISHKYPNSKPILSALHTALFIGNTKNKYVQITSIGDCVMEQTNAAIINDGLINNIHINAFTHYISGYTNTGSFDVLNKPLTTDKESSLHVTAISFFTYWGIPTYRNLMKSLWEDKISDNAADKLLNLITSHMESYINNVTTHQDTKIFLHNTAGLPWLGSKKTILSHPWNAQENGNYARVKRYIQKINAAIDSLIVTKSNVFLIDERNASDIHGLDLCESEVFPPETYEAYKLPIFHYSMLSFFIAEEYIKTIQKLFAIESKKVLFVDFDNTLWQGIMAEEQVNHFTEKQFKISELSKRGIILVALSKNTESLIRWNEMKTSKDDFTLLKINWMDKATNIKESLSALNLHADSCIVLDDSPHELDIIRKQAPEILCLNSTDINSWALIDHLIKKNNRATTDAQHRKNYYNDQFSRNSYLANTPSVINQHELLAPLHITLTVCNLSPNNIERALELLSRTNQFNCSGKTYTESELINAIASIDYGIKLFSLRDQFGDMGVIGAVFIRINHSKSEAIIENFVMSCRAIGYGAEDAMLSIAIQSVSCHSIVGIYKPTPKNTPASKLYSHAGFIQMQDSHQWFLDKTQTTPEIPTWIQIKTD